MENEIEKVSKFLKVFPKEFSQVGVNKIVNTTLKIARVRAIDNVCKTYFIKRQEVSKKIKIEKASKGETVGYLKSVGTVNGIEKFKVKYKGNRVLVAIKKSIGFQERDKSFANVIRKFSGNSEKGNGRGSNPTFSDERKKFGFRRSSKSKYPIQRLTGPSVPSMLSSKDVLEPLELIVKNELINNLETEVLKKFKK